MAKSLQERFLDSAGAPIRTGETTIVQMDSIQIPIIADVTLEFIGDQIFEDNAAVLAIHEPGKIQLSDGSWVTAVKVWDDHGLPRKISHRVITEGHALTIYNKYRNRHSASFITEDNFTGNAGMIVTAISSNRKRYECSSGDGQFNPRNLIFELEWNST